MYVNVPWDVVVVDTVVIVGVVFVIFLPGVVGTVVGTSEFVV